MFSIKKFIFLVLFCVSNYAYSIDLEEMVQDLIIERLGENITEVELQFDNKAKFSTLQMKDAEIRNVQLTYFVPNSSSFKISVTTENEEVYEMFGRYKAYVNLPVTTRVIAAGAIITEKDISLLKSPITKIRSGYIVSAEDVIGMQTKRTLGSGILLRQSDVIKPQVIRQNDSVTMVYNSGNIRLRTSGVAAEAGAVGDMIKIKNDTTGVIVYGRVKGKNLVEVGGER